MDDVQIALPFVIASVLLGWTWLAEHWQRRRFRGKANSTRTDRVLARAQTPERRVPVRLVLRRRIPRHGHVSVQ